MRVASEANPCIESSDSSLRSFLTATCVLRQRPRKTSPKLPAPSGSSSEISSAFTRSVCGSESPARSCRVQAWVHRSATMVRTWRRNSADVTTAASARLARLRARRYTKEEKVGS